MGRLKNSEYWKQFQSTLPMQGVTRQCPTICQYILHISIHTPYAGSDESAEEKLHGSFLFQSTLPMQGVTLFITRSITLS